MPTGSSAVPRQGSMGEQRQASAVARLGAPALVGEGVQMSEEPRRGSTAEADLAQVGARERG